ncbi:MAG: hypothetical protein ABI162_00915, partial [Luteolibacter sp.]
MKHTQLPRQIVLACASLLGLAAALHADDAPKSPSVAGPQAVASTASSALASLAPKGWVTTGPLVHPTANEAHPIVAVKDPSVVFHEGRWHIFATTAGSKGWGM